MKILSEYVKLFYIIIVFLINIKIKSAHLFPVVSFIKRPREDSIEIFKSTLKYKYGTILNCYNKNLFRSNLILYHISLQCKCSNLDFTCNIGCYSPIFGSLDNEKEYLVEYIKDKYNSIYVQVEKYFCNKITKNDCITKNEQCREIEEKMNVLYSNSMIFRRFFFNKIKHKVFCIGLLKTWITYELLKRENNLNIYEALDNRIKRLESIFQKCKINLISQKKNIILQSCLDHNINWVSKEILRERDKLKGIIDIEWGKISDGIEFRILKNVEELYVEFKKYSSNIKNMELITRDDYDFITNYEEIMMKWQRICIFLFFIVYTLILQYTEKIA